MTYSLQAQQLIERGKKASRNFREFVRFIAGFDPAAHEREWIDACQLIGDEPRAGHKFIIIAPPGFGKSQIISVLFIDWMIGRYPDEHFGLLSYADNVSWGWSAAIRRIITTSKPYKITFPHVKRDPQSWGSATFRVKRKSIIDAQPTLRAGGTRAAVISYRLSGLVLDDAIDAKQDANTEQRDKAFNNYETSILTRLLDKAFQLCIGTRWSGDDFIGRLMKRKREGWKVIHIKALDEKGNSCWPPDGKGFGFSKKELEIKEFESPEVFAIQYMGDTSGGKAGIIKRLSPYKEVPSMELVKAKDLLVGAGWDCALKDKERNHFTVGYVGGLDQQGRIWILDRKKDRWGTPEIIEKIYSVQKEWDPFTQWVEDAAGGTPAVQTIQAETPDAPVELVLPSHGGKRSRAHALAPYIHRGQIVFPKMASWFADAKYFITHFPYAGFDDDIDALWMLVSQLLSVIHPAHYEGARQRAQRGLRMV